jgi:3-hydroxybutyrate dehydrogenase
VIEGCDSGFGNALAARLDHLGFKVYAGCLDVNSRGAQDLKAKTSDRVQLVSLDVTSQEHVDEVYQLVTDTLDSHSKDVKIFLN